MKALTGTDRCFSTVDGRLSSVFNTDGIRRSEIDPDEARSAFDFDVERHPSYDERGVRIPGQYHLVKSTDFSFIPSCGVGERYTPIQHRDVYDFIVRELMPKVPDLRLETVGTLYGCGTGIVIATIGDEFRLPGDESPQRKRLFFSNPCNGRGSLVLGTAMVRTYCQNQLAASVSDAWRGGDRFVVQHTRNANFHIQGALRALDTQIKALDDLCERARRLAKIHTAGALLKRVLDRIYPTGRFEVGSGAETRIRNQRDDVIEQFEMGETAMSMSVAKTAWTVFNALTFPVFNPRTVTSRTDDADIAYGGLLGSRAQRISKWFAIVEREAKLGI